MEIGVFNVGGKYFAYRNVCPHAGAPVCLGKICGTNLTSDVYKLEYGREGEILRCPWHGWEFDLLTGEHLVDERTRLKSYEVEVAAGEPKETSEDLESFEVEVRDETIYVLI
jgi:nitrite reductase/ring-hydroxylating ferredoxin subunit